MAFSTTSREQYQAVLGEICAGGTFKEERAIHGPQGAAICVEYPAGSPRREVINMCSNNYLGLSNHPRVLEAARKALSAYGFGMSSVRFICGTQDLHRQLEEELTAFLGTEETILFSSCFDANAAAFEPLLDEASVMVSDRLVHASIVDGMRLAKASHDTYKHGDLDHLRKKLELYRDRPRKVVITDGVFSMDGDLAPLAGIVALAEEFDALVFVDDSHATGFMGATGRGTHEHWNVVGKIDLLSTTFGKALGGASGGCLSGRRELIAMLRQRGRPYLFSNSLAPAIAAATRAVLQMLQESPEPRERLMANTTFWRSALTELGYIIVPGASPIVPVMLYNAPLAQELSRELYAEGVYAVGFSFPVVPQGQARIRTQLSAAHTREHLERALAAFARVGRKHEILGKSKEELIERYGL